MARVELDGGEDSITSWSSSGNSNWSSGQRSSNWSSQRSGNWSSVWESSISNNWSSGNLVFNSSWSVNNGLDNWSVSNSSGSWESVWESGSNWETCGIGESSSIWVWESGNSWSSGNSNFISVSLLSGSSLIKSSLELSLGSGNLWGVLNSNWEWEVKDWSSQWFSGRDSWSNWEVGAGNSEAVDWISNIVDSLEETIGVNVLV